MRSEYFLSIGDYIERERERERETERDREKETEHTEVVLSL